MKAEKKKISLKPNIKEISRTKYISERENTSKRLELQSINLCTQGGIR